MNKLPAFACALTLAVGLSGCGSAADDLMKEKVKLKNEWAEALKSGDKSKKQEIDQRLLENLKKLADLKLSDADMKKLEEKYRRELDRAEQRISEARKESGLDDLSEKLDKILEDLKKREKGPGKGPADGKPAENDKPASPK